MEFKKWVSMANPEPENPETENPENLVWEFLLKVTTSLE